MRKFTSIILILLHMVLILPVEEVFAAEYRLKTFSLSPGKKTESTNFKLKQAVIGEPFGSKTSNGTYIVNIGYVASTASNYPRLISNIPDGFTSGTLDLDDYFVEPTGGTLTYFVTGNNSINISIDPITHIVTWSYSAGFVGSEEVFFIAENIEKAQTRSNGVILTARALTGTNNAPKLHHIEDITEFEGNVISLNASAYDADGDILTYTYSYPFDVTGQWLTSYNDAGTYIITITVSDGQASDSQSIKITVNDVNRAPVIESVNGVSVINGSVSLPPLDEGAIIELVPYAYDLDSDGITITYTSPFDMDGIWIIPNDYTSANPTKSLQNTITVSDGSLSASVTVNITVNNVNIAPTVTISLNPPSVNTNTDFTIHIEASDLDGDTLSYELKENGTVTETGSIVDMIDITKRKSSSGEYRYNVTVTDPSNKTASDIAYLEVIDTGAGQNDIFPVSGDFNGDGITDIGNWNKNKDTWAIALSEEGNFNDIRQWDAIFGKANYNINRTYPIMGDFNGDGLTDIGLYDNDGGKWKFALSDGSGFIYDATRDITGFGDGGTSPLVGDFNGDGITDIGYGSISYDGRFCIRIATKTGFNSKINSYETGLYNSTSYAADFNADGLTDVLAFKKDSGDWNILLSKYTEPTAVKDWIQDGGTTVTGQGDGSANIANCYDGDFSTKTGGSASGDNCNTEIIAIFEFASPQSLNQIITKAYAHGWANFATSASAQVHVELYYDAGWHRIYTDEEGGSSVSAGSDSFPIEINGNWSNVTKVKVRAYGGGGSLYGAASSAYIYEAQAWGPENGASGSNIQPAFTTSENWLSGFGANKEPVIRDYNHDGKTDIGYFDKSKGEWHVALSKGANEGGAGFVEKSGTAWPNVWPASSGNEYLIPMGGDINGDAIGDALAFDLSQSGVLNKWKRKIHNSKLPDLLIGIDNGIGGTTSIEYDLSTKLDNKDQNGKERLPFPVRVVKKVTATDGLGSSYVTNYEYSGGMFETDSREFRGFRHVKVIDPEGHYKETDFNQDDIYKGRPSKEEVYDKYGRDIQHTIYDWQEKGYELGKVSFPYLRAKTTTLFDYKTHASKQVETLYEYDDYGNVTRIQDLGFIGAGEEGDEKETNITYEYNIAKWIVSKPKTSETTGTPVVKSQYTYDDNGSLLKEEKWLNTESKWIATNFTYDSYGNVVTVTDALGRTTTTTYDATKTFPASVSNALGHTQSFTYDYATGKILTSTDPNGQTTTSQYDGFGRLTEVTGPGGISKVNYTYDLVSRPVKVTSTTKVNDTENTTTYSWADGLGRTIETIGEADGGKYILSGLVKYDSRGQVIEKYLPTYVTSADYAVPTYTGKHVTYQYDPLGRVTMTIRPDNKVSQNIYAITTIETINENAQRKRVEKDAYGRIIKVEEFNEGSTYTTTYEYDTLDNLIKTTDTLGNITTIKYDSLGRKIDMNDPDMGIWTYSYDDVGNLVSQTDAKGQTITFEYDAINRLKSKSTGVTYTYDQGANSIGRLSNVTDSSGTTQFVYDILGREVQTTKTIDSTPYTVMREYDSLDRLKSVTYSDGVIVKYDYNKQGGIKRVYSPGTGGDVNYVTTTKYTQNGQLDQIEYGNGTFTKYNYDENNLRLTVLGTYTTKGRFDSGQNPDLQSLSYAFDPVGNVKQITDTVNSNTQSFSYDDLNRLTSATGPHYGTINYEYDTIGNMLRKGDKVLIYGEGTAGPHAVTKYGDTVITYDANGNMQAKGSTTYTYDTENRLIEVAIPRGGEVSSVTLNFAQGWNFFSLPYRNISLRPDGTLASPGEGSTLTVIEDIHIKTILSGATYDQISKYDESVNDPNTGHWQHYVGNVKFDQFPKLPSGEDCHFTYGEGYLIYVTAPSSITITGSTLGTPQPKTLNSGWNLVLSPTSTTIPVQDALEGVIYDSVKHYNGTTYDDVTTFEAGEAYWIHTASIQAWNIKTEEDITQFVYDGDGGRTKRIFEDRTTIYIGSSYEIEVDNVTKDIIKYKKLIYLGSSRVCEIEQEGDSTPKAYFVHADHIGSSNIITDESGQRVSLFEYEPYGSVAYAAEDNTYDTDKKFTGKTYDSSSGLHYYGARYYDSELGRFITADPTIQHPYDPQDFNRYAYARNNPIKYIDPTGYGWWSNFWKALVGGIVAGVVLALTGGAGAPAVVAFMAAGIAGGITTGALQGGLQGALIGGAIGAFTGYGFAIGGPAFAIGMAAIGAGYAAATGGWEGLGDYAAGLAGGLIGGAIGYNVGSGISSTLAGQTTVQSSLPETNADTLQNDPAFRELLGKTQLEIVDDYIQEKLGVPSALAKLKAAYYIARATQTGALGNTFYSGILAARQGESFASYYGRFKGVYAGNFAYSEALGFWSITSVIEEGATTVAFAGAEKGLTVAGVNALLNPRASIGYTSFLFRSYNGIAAASRISNIFSLGAWGATAYRAGLWVNARLSYWATYVW